MTDTKPAPTVLADFFPVDLAIDGRVIAVQIKRFDLDEYTAFQRDFARCGRIGKREQLWLERHRQPLTDRQGHDVVLDGAVQLEDDDTVLARLELDETPEDRARREARDTEDERFSRAFLIGAIQHYVTVEPGQLSTAREPITTGEQVLRYYASRQDVLQLLLARVYTENVLSEEQKKTLASRRASPSTSIASNLTVDGDGPAPTADAASEKVSASPETATASRATSSGATDRSSSRPVRSSRSRPT